MTGKSSEEINAAAWELRQILPFGNFARLSMIAEPYAPIINTGMLEEMPFHHLKKGEMHDKPTIIDVTDNEGYMFVKPAFSGSKCPNETYPDSQHVCQENFDLFFEKLLSEENFQALKEFGYYNCPEDGSECLHKADEFLTDFTWYCNLRRCLEDGYPQSDIFRFNLVILFYLKN
jgi:carboxylesterase type B